MDTNNRTEVTTKASEAPPVFGKGDRWSVLDEYGNKYAMKKCPNDIFLRRKGNNMELCLVYSTEDLSKLPGQNGIAPVKKDDPF